MTYEASEYSSQDGQPVVLYRFANERGTFHYTSRTEPVDYDSSTFEPQAITHGEVSSSGDMTKDQLSIELPRDNVVAQLLMLGEVDTPTTLTVFRGHGEHFVVYWRGRVASSNASGAVVSVECESVFTSMRRPGLRARYQRACRHNLYSPGCGVDREAVKVEGEATVVQGNAVVVPAAADFAAGYFVGGYIKIGDATRFIVDHAGAAITLMRPLAALTAAELPVAITLYPGCDKSRETCNTKFSNLENFGGFPWIPLKNPFGGSSLI